MAILLSKQARVELARSFLREIRNVVDEDNNKLYDYYNFALARTTSWSDESTPEEPYDSQKYLNEFRNNIMFTQKVNPSDVCHLIPRKDWISGTIYDPYDDDYSSTNTAQSGATTLADANFYVLTSDDRVYKCIDNRDPETMEVVESTDEPKLTTTDIFETDEGYRWKFMFQIAEADKTKFLDAEHIPVRKLTTDSPQVGGTTGLISAINVTDSGSDYTSTPTVIINGDGTGAAATAIMDGSGGVDSIDVSTPGLGYSFAFITFTGGGGTGAEASVQLGDSDPDSTSLQRAVEDASRPGTIERILITDGGRDYVDGDTFVKIVGDSVETANQATATVTIAEGTGAITAVEMDNVGREYTYADITFVNSAGEENSLATRASARAVISPIKGHGNNPVTELFSTTVGVVVSLDDNDNKDLILDNDFRQIGLIKNVYNFDEDAIWREASGTASYIINVTDSSPYSIDDIVFTDAGTSTEGKFRVIQIVESTREGVTSGTFDIYLQAIVPNIDDDSVITIEGSDSGSLTINSFVSPDISTHYGDIVYIENRQAITRSEDQVETIKALVNF